MGVMLPVIKEIQALENRIEDAYEPKRPWNPDKEEEAKFRIAYTEWENKISRLKEEIFSRMKGYSCVAQMKYGEAMFDEIWQNCGAPHESYARRYVRFLEKEKDFLRLLEIMQIGFVSEEEN